MSLHPWRHWLIAVILFGNTVVHAKPAPKLTPEERRIASNIAIIKDTELKNRPHEVLGSIEAFSCQRSAYGKKASKDEARQLLIVKAIRKDANAIANMFCQKGGLSWKRNCFNLWTCAGDAIKWKTPGEAPIESDKPAAKVQESSCDVATQLEKLKALHDSGALSDEEYTKAKAAVLDL
jgi:hypothetical protein